MGSLATSGLTLCEETPTSLLFSWTPYGRRTALFHAAAVLLLLAWDGVQVRTGHPGAGLVGAGVAAVLAASGVWYATRVAECTIDKTAGRLTFSAGIGRGPSRWNKERVDIDCLIAIPWEEDRAVAVYVVARDGTRVGLSPRLSWWRTADREYDARIEVVGKVASILPVSIYTESHMAAERVTKALPTLKDRVRVGHPPAPRR